MSGQITVTTAGTQVTGPASNAAGGFAAKAHPDNTDTVWVRAWGDSTKGYPLNPGEAIVLTGATLTAYQFDADVNGEKICWMAL